MFNIVLWCVTRDAVFGELLLRLISKIKSKIKPSVQTTEATEILKGIAKRCRPKRLELSIACGLAH